VLTDEAEDVERLLGFLGDLVVNLSLDVKTVHGAWHADVLMVLVRGKPKVDSGPPKGQSVYHAASQCLFRGCIAWCVIAQGRDSPIL